MDFTGERMMPGENKEDVLYLEHMSRYFFASQFVKGKIVLDIACGSGYGSDILAKSGAKKVYGIDISAEAIEYCRKNYSNENIEFKTGSVDDIQLDDGSVDAIVSLETIEHVNAETQKKFLSEAKRIIKKDGVFVVSTPNPLVYSKGNKFHLKELNFDELESLLERYFTDVKVFFQDNIESSFILSADDMKKDISSDESIRIEARKIGILQPMESMYFIAVCSNGKYSDAFRGYVSFSDIKPRVLHQVYQKNADRAENFIRQREDDFEKLADAHKQALEELAKAAKALKKADNCKFEIKSATVELGQKLKQKKQEIRQKELLIRKKEQEIKRIDRELYEIRTSLRWKIPNYLYKKYIKLKNKLKIK